jgi:preprotein translocase subunit SecE
MSAARHTIAAGTPARRLEEGEVAESKRRGEDAVEDRFDEAPADEYVADEETDGAEDALEHSSSRSGAATGVRSRERAASTTRSGGRSTDRAEKRVGLLGRFRRFVLEVIAELRKVIRPTRKELLTYTAVVVVFVTVMVTLVAMFDWAFAHAVLWVFGGK